MATRYDALVIVIRTDSRDVTDGWDFAAELLKHHGDVMFVGEPWRVKPNNQVTVAHISAGAPDPDPEFGTAEAIAQRFADFPRCGHCGARLPAVTANACDACGGRAEP